MNGPDGQPDAPANRDSPRPHPLRPLILGLALALAPACGIGGGPDGAGPGPAGTEAESGAGSAIPEDLTDDPRPVTEYVATATDFSDCILPRGQADTPPEESWHRVRNFFVKNPTGRARAALEAVTPTVDGELPVGTFVQLIFFEAMVKRGGDFCPQANGWEFFSLNVSEAGTTIESRGCTEVTNFAGGNCFDCHAKAEPRYDLICETGHGCDPLSIDAEGIRSFQEDDPRCPEQP